MKQIQFLQERKILICHHKAEIRIEVKGILKEKFKIHHDSILTASDFNEALAHMNREKENLPVIITQALIDKENFIPLYQSFSQYHPECFSRAFMVIDSQNNPFTPFICYQHHIFSVFEEKIQHRTLEEFVCDAMMGLETFAQERTKEQLKEVLSKISDEKSSFKVFKTDIDQLLAGKNKFSSLEIIHYALKEIDKNPVSDLSQNKMNYCYLKAIKITERNLRYYNLLLKNVIEQKELKKCRPAIDQIFKQSIALQTIDLSHLKHFVTALLSCQLTDQFIEYTQKMMTPELLRSYQDDLLCYHDDAETSIKEMRRQYALSLLVCAQFLKDHNKMKDSVSALELSYQVAPDDEHKIKSHIINQMIQCQAFEQAKKILKETPDEFISPEMEVLQFYLDRDLFAPDKVLQKGLHYLNKGIKELKVFEMILEGGVKLKRRKDFMEEIIEEATRCYPEMEQYFGRFLKDVA